MEKLVEPQNARIYDLKSFDRNKRIKIDDALINELKTYGEVNAADPWNDYESFNLTEDKARQLAAIVEMDHDGDFNSDEDEALPWVPLHAWRILITKRSEPAIPSLIGRVTLADDEDDWAKDEIPRGLETFGPLAVDYIINEFKTETIFGQEAFGYSALIETLTGIAKVHSTEHDRVARFLRELLADFEILPPIFNAFVVCGLIDMKDAESAPLVQRVFEHKFLDEEIVDWDWVKKNLGATDLPDKITHEKPKGNDFHYSGDEKFQKLLKAIGSTFNVDEVKCLIVGTFLAVDLVQPTKVAGRITDDAEEEGGVFQSDGQAMYFYREFFGLWNELSKFQTELFQLPIGLLGKDANGLDDKALNSMKIFWTKMRLLAFSQGLSMGNTDEERFAGTPIGDFIEYIESKVGQFDELEDEKRYSSEVVDGLLAEVESFWNQYYLPFANSCRDFCRQEIERQKFVEENKNVGRNEPCPCGSGKKFKKCCMVIH